MTSLGIALATAALQVTFAALVALAVVLWTPRRSPRTAGNLAAAALGLCGLLTIAALVPIPDWWTWDAPSPWAENQPVAVAEQDTMASAPVTGGSGISLRRLARLMPPNGSLAPSAESHWDAWAIVAAVFLAGAAFELTRLVAGLLAIAAIRRRSAPVADKDLIAEVDELRWSIGVPVAVPVRQSAAVGTAATVGWRRPVILLAADWRTWDAAERRAVLAHELAHVRQRDYLVGMFALIGRAVHFYHPLVRWLAGRLRLHQELAADALASAVAGGRSDYLKALARLALRQDAEFGAGVARPFLSARGSLQRRVAMLLVTDDGRPLGRVKRWGMAALLVAAALGASAVRGPAQAPAPAPAEDVPPFDVSHVPASANMLVAFRPAAVLSKPGMKPLAEWFNRMIATDLKDIGFPPEIMVTVEEIEQVVLTGEGRKLTPPPGQDWKPGQPQQAIFGDTILIRMTHDVDWPALIRAGAAAAKAQVREVRPGLFCVTGAADFYFRVADRRTLLCPPTGGPKGGADAESLLARQKPAADPTAAWGPAWPKVETSAAVIALDNRKAFWTDVLGPLTPPPGLLAAIGRPGHVVACLDLADTVTAHLYATADENVPGQRRMKMDALTVALLAGLRDNPSTTAAQRTACRIMRETLAGRSISRDGPTDIAEFRSPAKLADLLLNMDMPRAAKERSP